MTPFTAPTLDTPLFAPTDHEVVELPLLLSRWQADALEAAARARNMTAGQMLRRVITDLFVDARPATR